MEAQLRQYDLPRHLALFYESTSTQFDAAAASLKYAFSTNHKCLYLLDTNYLRQVKAALRAASIDVERRIDAGDLTIRDASSVYLDSGFDPERMIQTLEDACNNSLVAGYDGLCVVGENSWCFHTEMEFDHILDFEAEFDMKCPDLPVIALCQYDLTRFSGESAAKALWTHENIIYRGTVCENPFYIPPDEYMETADTHLNAKLMLEQAYSLTQSRQQVERHEQRLEVVNRILRHNIRNDLNVVSGNLELIKEASVSAAIEDRVDEALEHVTQVFDVAEKARYVKKTLESSRVEVVPLDPVIETAVDEATATYPEAEIKVTGVEDVSALADPNFDRALVEALTNGIRHQEQDPSMISLTVTVPTEQTVQIEVRNPGSIPETERQSVQRGYETELDHGSGMGLWMIHWIVENSHGSLTFPKTADNQTTICIELLHTYE
ncbi:MEDS domain-containing protein [Natrinema longum]|uniref:MEDS domain-containing protein n=1 Tax=Natrinema longum TaxID=370324 RepID=UPI001CCF0158|nr:MEDS domain-containing protein [Natrinema longum]MBZ6496948.1 MEDS domain-containing protein [Natrinema longum]